MTERERITQIIAFGLRHKSPALRWKSHDDDAPKRAAEALLQHLELSNVQLTMGPPLGHHSTPGDPQ